jgi:DNA-binding transcriptional MocR family regulator
VAELVRAQIADGTLRPGDLAPSGEALSRVTGHARPTCRQALRALVDDGTLEPPDSIYGRPRVPGGQVRDRQDISPAAGVLSRRSRPGASRPG